MRRPLLLGRAVALTIVTALSLTSPATMAAASAPQVRAAAVPAQASLYFAEGNTLPGWLEYLTILNPNVTQTATVDIRYSCEQPAGNPVGCGIAGNTTQRVVPPLTRDTVAVFDPAQGGVNGTFTGVGATLSSNVPIVAERPMYMTQPAGAFSQIGGSVVGAHDATAARPQTRWIFAEGTTQPDFQQYLTLLNPSTATVPATITYSIEGASAVVRTRNLPPLSRTTIDVVSAEPGALGQKVVGLATVVTAPLPIVVERPLYFIHDFGGAVGAINGATDKPGKSSAAVSPPGQPRSEIAFAEGNGLPDFTQFLTVLNTSQAAGTLSIRYLVEGQTTPVLRSCPIGAFARLTINVSEVASNPPGAQGCSLGRENAGVTVAKGVAAQLSAEVPIVAERPMYFSRDFPEIGRVDGAHDVFGVIQPEESSAEFFVAEGSTRNGFDQFWTLSNPNAAAIRVGITYLYNPSAGKANETLFYDVPANSRKTVQVFNPADGGVGRSGDAGFDFGARFATVNAAGTSTGQLFGVERPFYTRRVINGQATDDGHDITAVRAEEVFGPPIVPAAWPMFHQNNQRTAFTPNPSVGSNPTQRWQFTETVFGAAQSPVVGANNIVYLALDTLTDGSPPNFEVTAGVVAVDGATGARKWVLPTGVGTTLTEDINGPITVGPNGNLYLSFGNWVVALTDTGPAPVELWRFPEIITPDIGGYNGAPTVASDGTVYAPTSEGYLVAIAPPSGSNPDPTLKWAFQTWPARPLDRDLKSLPAIAPDGTIYVGSDDPRGVLYALRDDTTTATIMAQVVISPTISNTIIGGLDRKDVNSTPALDVARNALYIGSDDGKLYSFTTPGLTPRWEMTAGIPPGPVCHS